MWDVQGYMCQNHDGDPRVVIIDCGIYGCIIAGFRCFRFQIYSLYHELSTNVRESKELVFFHVTVELLLTAVIYCEYFDLLQRQLNLGDKITKQLMQVPLPHCSHHYFPNVQPTRFTLTLTCSLFREYNGLKPHLPFILTTSGKWS